MGFIQTPFSTSLESTSEVQMTLQEEHFLMGIKDYFPPCLWRALVTYLQRGPSVRRNLLLHDEVKEPSFLFVLNSTAGGLDLLLQLAAPLSSI